MKKNSKQNGFEKNVRNMQQKILCAIKCALKAREKATHTYMHAHVRTHAGDRMRTRVRIRTHVCVREICIYNNVMYMYHSI